jgi:hypothetical protein
MRNIHFLFVHIIIRKGTILNIRSYFSYPLLHCLWTDFTLKKSTMCHLIHKNVVHWSPFIWIIQKHTKKRQFVSPFPSAVYLNICIYFLHFFEILCALRSDLIVLNVKLSECLYEKRKMKMKEMKRLILSHCVV